MSDKSPKAKQASVSWRTLQTKQEDCRKDLCETQAHFTSQDLIEELGCKGLKVHVLLL